MDAPESTTAQSETVVDEDEKLMSLFELIMGNIDAMDEFESEKLVVTEEAASAEEDSADTTTTTTGSADSERPKGKTPKSKRTTTERKDKRRGNYTDDFDSKVLIRSP